MSYLFNRSYKFVKTYFYFEICVSFNGRVVIKYIQLLEKRTYSITKKQQKLV